MTAHRLRLPLLLALALAAGTSAATDGSAIVATGFSIEGSQAFSEAELRQAIAPALGQALTRADLIGLADRLTDFYRQHGYGRAHAILPAQDFSEGKVRFYITTANLPTAPDDLMNGAEAGPPDRPSEDPVHTLLRHARWWDARGRNDLAQDALDKLFKLSPDEPDGLAMQARVAISRNDADTARSALTRLRQRLPAHADIGHIEALLRTLGESKSDLRQVRSLAKAGRYDDAIAAFNTLFPDGPPSDDYALEYWQLVANTPSGWFRARNGMRALVQRNPDNINYRLALAEHKTTRLPLDRAALKTLIGLVNDPIYGQRAHIAWRSALRRLDDEPASLPLLRRYLTFDPNDSTLREKQRTILAAQARLRKLMADPDYRAGMEGLALLEQDQNDRAVPLLERAVRAYPREEAMTGGLALARLRQGRHDEAQVLFLRANTLAEGGSARWQSLAKVARFWGLMREVREARDAGQLDLAEIKVNAVLKIDPAEPNAIAALGDIQAARGQSAEATTSYRRALAIESANGAALEGLLALNRRQGMTQAQHFIDTLTPEQRREIGGAITRLDLARIEAAEDSDSLLDALDSLPAERRTPAIAAEWGAQLERLAGKFERNGEHAEAVRLLEEAENVVAEQEESALLALASTWGDIHGDAQATRLFAELRDRHTPPAAAWRLRHARYLAQRNAPGLDEDLAALSALPLQEDERATLARLREDHLLRQAEADLDAAAPERAQLKLDAALGATPDSVPLLLARARAERAQSNWSAALGTYDRVLHLQLDESEALRGRIETHLAANERDTALTLLNDWAAAGIARNPYDNLRQIDLFLELDQPKPAHDMLDALMAQQPHGSNLLNRAWKLAEYENRPDDEIVYLQQAMAADEAERTSAASGQPVVAKPYTEYGYDELGDPKKIQREWLDKKLALLIDRRSDWFSAAVDWRASSGTPGLSRSTFIEAPLEYKRPASDGGELFFRADAVSLDVGTLAADRTDFGAMALCQPNCQPALLRQRAQGIGFTAGYQREDLRADIGVTPPEFPVSNIVGGVRLKGDLGYNRFSYSAEALRRPVNTSLLTYAGTRDPASGTVWGGVVESGLRLGLSRFIGDEPFGFWSSLDLLRITGRNVMPNNRVQLMAGGQWRFINEENRLFAAGVSGRLTRNAYNVGEYTFGHGGYYSPEDARALSFSARYGERSPRFSWVLGGSVSTSQSRTAAAPYFPLDPALQQQAATIDPYYAASNSAGGWGYSLDAEWEYQLGKQMFVGGLLSVERADYYSPNRVLLYLRYALDHPAAQPVNFGPEPVLPSSEF